MKEGEQIHWNECFDLTTHVELCKHGTLRHAEYARQRERNRRASVFSRIVDLYLVLRCSDGVDSVVMTGLVFMA